MNHRQSLFVLEYLKDLNGTQAAIRAGYSQKTAYAIAEENLRKPEIAAAVKDAMDQRAKRVEISADYVLSTIQETIERCRQAEPVKIGGEESGEYKFDSNAVLKGAELLGKHLKLWTDKQEITGANGGAIKTETTVTMSPEQAYLASIGKA